MAIRIHLPRSMAPMMKGRTEVEVNGATVGECLNALGAISARAREELFYPAKEERSLERGLLRPVVALLVNKKRTGTEGLATGVTDGDEIQIKLNLH